MKKLILADILTEAKTALPRLKPEDVLKHIPMDSYKGVYPPNKKEDPEEYKYPDKDTAFQDAREIIEMFQAMPDPIPVYRLIHAKDESKIKLDHAGDWAWSEKAALDFGLVNNVPKPWVLLKGFAPKKDIDWGTTLKLFFMYSDGGGYGAENELRIWGKDVKDIAWEWVDKKKPAKKAKSFIDYRSRDPKYRQGFQDELPGYGPYTFYGQGQPIFETYPMLSKVMTAGRLISPQEVTDEVKPLQSKQEGDLKYIYLEGENPWVSHDHPFFIFALRGEETVAHVMFDLSSDSVYVRDMFVKPVARRKGLMTKLLNWAKEITGRSKLDYNTLTEEGEKFWQTQSANELEDEIYRVSDFFSPGEATEANNPKLKDLGLRLFYKVKQSRSHEPTDDSKPLGEVINHFDPTKTRPGKDLVITLIVATADDDVIASAYFQGFPNVYGKKVAATKVIVTSAWQRKGIGTEIYKQVKALGYEIEASSEQTDAGKAFWKKFPTVSKVLSGFTSIVPSTGHSEEGRKFWNQPNRPFGKGWTPLSKVFAAKNPPCFNVEFDNPDELRDILPKVFEEIGIDPYETFYAITQDDKSIDISWEPLKSGMTCEFFHYLGSKLHDSMTGIFHGEALEKFDNLTDLLEWIIPLSDEKVAASSMRSLAKATLPEDSELMEFYYMADAEGWREEQVEEALREWELMDEEERREVISDLISEGYSSHFNHDPKTEEEWNEVRDYYVSMRERQEMDNENNTSMTFFEKAKIMTNPTLIRFQHKPLEGSEFKGYGPSGLGLTYHYTPAPGDLSFAVDKKELKTAKDWQSFSSKYGKHAYEFKVPYAVKAWHISDYEWQVIFDVTTVKDLKKIELPSIRKTKKS